MRFFPWKRKNSLSDEELVSAYRDGGDKALVGELYVRYSHLVYGVCLNYFRDRELARDAVLQLFEKLFVTLRNTQPENFKNWLGFVARNYCITELRKMKVKQERNEDYLQGEETEVFQQNDEEPLKKEEQLKRLEKAVKDLGDDQRTCIELFYFRDKSYKEIAEITGYTENQVKSHIQNGKRNLKIRLEDQP
jgi:RNA polymerase sigma factor (sigma-70 family)